MSMVVMRRKIQAKQMLAKKNAETGMFALSYTNTGKNLMGRTVSRAKTLPPRLRAQKYRRVDCCTGASEFITKDVCFGSTVGIEKVPILQMSYRNRLKRLALSASARPCVDKCIDLSTNKLWKLSPEKHASFVTERLAAAAILSDYGCTFKYKVKVINNKFVVTGVTKLTFKVGNTYIFDVSDPSNNAPLHFTTNNIAYDTIDVFGTEGEENATVIFRPQEKGTVKMVNRTTLSDTIGSLYNNMVVLDSDENLIRDKTCFQVERSQNSLKNRTWQSGLMGITKDIKKSDSASDQIAKKKAVALDCDKDRTPFTIKNCTPSA